MAKKASFPLEDPPSVSSSDEDEISSEEDDEQIMEENEPKEPVTVNPTAKQEDSDSDSENVSPNRRSGSGMKRRSEGTSTESIAKMAKTGQKSAGTSIIKRLWSEDDEITLLQRLIDFNADKGTNPFEDKEGFFEFVKKEISFVVSKRQVLDKIRTLKKKYIGIGNYRLIQSHDKDCLRLVKHIWRNDGTVLLTSENVVEEEDNEVFSHSGEDSGRDKVVEEGVKVVLGSGEKLIEENEVLAHVGEGSGKMAIEQDEVLARDGGDSELRDPDWFEKSVLVQSIARYGVAEHIVKERWSLFSGETKKELGEEWKSLESKELHVVSLKMKYTSELASKFAEAI